MFFFQNIASCAEEIGQNSAGFSSQGDSTGAAREGCPMPICDAQQLVLYLARDLKPTVTCVTNNNHNRYRQFCAAPPATNTQEVGCLADFVAQLVHLVLQD